MSLGLAWAMGIYSLATAQYEGFHSYGNDLALYHQIIWATAQGSPFYTSLLADTTHFLGHHFEPWLAGLALLYPLWPEPSFLLALQTFALATSSVPLFWFARRYLPLLPALTVLIAYFLSPFLAAIALAEFHEVAMAVPFLMMATIALVERWPRATVVWLVLALGWKEEVALIAVGFGCYAWLVQRRTRFGPALLGGALVAALVIMQGIIPAFNTSGRSYSFVERYGTLGETPAQALRTLLTEPRTVATLLATPGKPRFVALLLLGAGGLPLLSSVTLLALPTLFYLLLSDYPLHYSLSQYYSAPLLPILYLAAVLGLARLYHWKRQAGHAATVALLLMALGGARGYSALPGGMRHNPERFVVTDTHREIRQALVSLPSEVKVYAEWRYFPDLSARWLLDDILRPTARPIHSVVPDYLVTTVTAPDATYPPTYPWLGPELHELAPHEPLRLPRFRLERVIGESTAIWQRDEAPPVTLQRYDASVESGLQLVAAGVPPEVGEWSSLHVPAGATVPIWLAWGASEPLTTRLAFTLQLFRGEERVAQIDQEMGQGKSPTTQWHVWMTQPVVVDVFALSLPAELPPGRYELRAGAYEQATVTPLTRPDGSALITLTTITVQPAPSEE